RSHRPPGCRLSCRKCRIPTLTARKSGRGGAGARNYCHPMRELIEQMTLEEKVGVVSGADVWHNHPVERLGVPALKVSDGPNGARGESFSGGPSSVCVPCGTALAATWNVELVNQIGALLGREARRKAARVLLAPTVNI